MLARLVYRQGWTIVDGPGLTKLVRPLVAILRVTVRKLIVINEVVMGSTLPILTLLEALLGFADDLFVVFHCIQPVCVLEKFSLTGWCNSDFCLCGFTMPGKSSVRTQIQASALFGDRSPV